MLDTKIIGNTLLSIGVKNYSGVPCSHLKNLINYAENFLNYIPATNEGDAIAIATGLMLGGQKTAVLLQNSGLGNAVSPLTSLSHTFELPVLVFMSHRGAKGINDEPQHQLMGEITPKLLETMKIEYAELSQDIEVAKQQILKANSVLENGKSFVFIVKKNTFSSVELISQSSKPLGLLTRKQILGELVKSANPNTVFVSSTGYTSRQLYDLCDHGRNFYMVGSMGCASSIALGLALAKPDKEIIVIDGDGSLMMRMGALCTIGAQSPKNLLHVVLDNNCHESTGKQKTNSESLNIPQIAASCSYPKSYTIQTLSEVTDAIDEWRSNMKLSLLYVKTALMDAGSLGRPKITPPELAKRLLRYLHD